MDATHRGVTCSVFLEGRVRGELTTHLSSTQEHERSKRLNNYQPTGTDGACCAIDHHPYGCTLREGRAWGTLVLTEKTAFGPLYLHLFYLNRVHFIFDSINSPSIDLLYLLF